MTFRSSARLRVRTGSGATRLLPARSPTASSALGSPNTTVARTEASGTIASAPVTVTANQGGAFIRRPKVEFLHVAVQILNARFLAATCLLYTSPSPRDRTR